MYMNTHRSECKINYMFWSNVLNQLKMAVTSKEHYGLYCEFVVVMAPLRSELRGRWSSGSTGLAGDSVFRQVIQFL